MSIGFIGCGNMGSSIIEGILNAKYAPPAEVMIYDANTETMEKAKKRYGIAPAKSASELARTADIIMLCVKPNVLYSVIDAIKQDVNEEKLIISIAAGQSINSIEKSFGKQISLIRVMPNTPALVGEGMSALSPNSNVSEQALDKALALFKCCGRADIVPERLMDAVTAVSGSSPAYVFMLIEAMADAAVMGGMPRSQAYTFAAQAVMGSAKMVLETAKHPAELKDMVCSPSGTTIEAVASLESTGFRSAIIEAMRACMNKSKEM